MTTGRRPFEARLPTGLAADIHHQPPTRPSQHNPKLSCRLEEITVKCLEKKSDYGYQPARDLRTDFRRLGHRKRFVLMLKLEGECESRRRMAH